MRVGCMWRSTRSSTLPVALVFFNDSHALSGYARTIPKPCERIYTPSHLYGFHALMDKIKRVLCIRANRALHNNGESSTPYMGESAYVTRVCKSR